MKPAPRSWVSLAICVACLGSWVLARAGTVQAPTGTWAAAGPLSEGRSGAAAVQMPDGRVLVTGGQGSDRVLASSEIFDDTGHFTSAAPMSTPRARHSAALLPNGQVLVAGGLGSGGQVTSSAEIYDPATGSWSAAGALAEARAGHTASLLPDGRVLVAGGEGVAGPLASLEVFDPDSNAFSAAGHLSSPRKNHAAAVMLGSTKVLITGGTDGSAALSSVDVYDLLDGSVSPGPALLTPREGHSATALLDDSVLVVGGSDGTTDLATAEILNLDAGAFEVLAATLASARRGHTALLLPNNNNVLIVGGTSAGVAQSSAELFTPSEGAFSATGPLASPRAGGAFVPTGMDGVALAAGGQDGSGALAGAEVYGFATVKTDRDDYEPGETVTISGAGWEPGETVSLVLHEVPTTHADTTLTAVADAAGRILNAEFVPDDHDRGIRFFLTAAGSHSRAQNTFTDHYGLYATPISTTQVRLTWTNTNSSFKAVWYLPPGSNWIYAGSTQSNTFTVGGLNPCTSYTFAVGDFYHGHYDPYLYANARTLCNPTQIRFVSSPFTVVTGQCSPGVTIQTQDPYGAPASPPLNLTVSIFGSAGGTAYANSSCTSPISTVVIPAGGSTATFFFKPARAGTQTLFAAASGLSQGSQSEFVNRASTTTTITSDSPDPSNLGQSVSVSVTVSVNPPGSGVPLGSVGISDGSASCGTSAPTGSCGLTPLTAGQKTLTATYSGSSDYAESSDTEVHDVLGNDPPSFDPIADQSTSVAAGLQSLTVTGISPGPPSESSQTVTLSGTSSDTSAVSNPTLSEVTPGGGAPSPTFFGGAGDQRGAAIFRTGSDLYLAGRVGSSGLLQRYGIPPGSPAMSTTLAGNTYFEGVSAAGSTMFAVGGALPAACGASDGVGGTEHKSAIARYDSAGNLLSCQSANFFNYRGGEWYSDAITVETGGVPSVYVTGGAETCGFGHTLFVLTRYNQAGTLLQQVTEPGVSFGAGSCIGNSDGKGITALNGFLYVSGQSSLTSEDGFLTFARPSLMKYDTGFNRIWKRRPTDYAAGVFNAVTAMGSHVYAVGYQYTPNVANSTNYLIEKYDEAGDRIWSRISGGANDDMLNGVAEMGGRLFAVGFTRSSGAGGSDVSVLEIDPATGNTLSTTLFGGAQDDQANGVTVAGGELYVAAESRSFANGGNLVGQNDVLLLRYTPSGTATLSYTPLRRGSATITVTANDGQAFNNTFSRTFTVNVLNSPPSASNDTITTPEDTPRTLNASGNDTDVDGDSLTVASVTQGTHGSVVINGDGTLTYTPAPNFNGPDSFSYTISDGQGGTASALVSVTVTAVNDAPAAVNDTASTNEDTPLIVAAPGVLGNDPDPDSPSLTAVLVSGPSHGTLTLNADGSFTYTPAANYNGPDGFTYKANDGSLDSNLATVSLTVAAVNDEPYFDPIADQTTSAAAGAQSVAVAGISPGPADEFSQVVTLSGSSSDTSVVSNPTFTMGSAGGSVTALFFGGAGDQRGASLINEGTTLFVAGTNGSNGLLVRYDLPLSTPSWSQVLGGNTYLEGVTLNGTTAFGVGGALPPACGASDGVGGTEHKSGLARYTTGGSLLSCQSMNYFDYRGGEGYSDAVTVGAQVYAVGGGERCGFGHSVFVMGKYDASGGLLGSVTELGSGCVGGSHAFAVVELSGALYLAGESRLSGLGEDNVNKPVLMRYDTTLNRVWKRRTLDYAGGAYSGLTALGGFLYAVGYEYNPSLPNSVNYLVEKFDESGNRIWTRSFGGSQEDRLTGVVGLGTRLFAVGYTRSAGSGGSDVTVFELDPADGSTLSETLYGGAQDDLAQDVVTDGTALYVVGESRSFANAGNIVGQNDVMLLRYVPATTAMLHYTPLRHGTATITVEAADGQLVNNTFSRTFTVTVQNSAPAAVNDTAATAEDTPVTLDPRSNDTDLDGDTLGITGNTQGANGSVVCSVSSCSYTPAADFNGPDSFSYTISDGQGGTASALVSVTVTAVNDAPAAVNDTASTNEDTPLIVAAPGVLGNDPDPDSPSLTAVLVSGPSHGTLTLNADGSFTYTPAANYNGPDGFTYKANDGSLESNVATVSLIISAVNDAPAVNAGADQTADEGSTVSLALATFADPDAGNTHVATISWGDGTATEAGVVGGGTVSGSHAYADDGVYRVAVCVTDDDGATTCDDFTVTVSNVTPGVEAGADQTADEGATVSLSPASFNDKGTGDSHTATVDWGDGSGAQSAAVTETPSGPPGSTSGTNGTVSSSHAYADNGSYAVTVCVTDDDGAEACDRFTVSVVNVAPVVNAGAEQTADEGSTLSLAPATFADKGNDTHVATISWGDGTATEAGVVGGGTVSGSHVYADDGVYGVAVCVTDDDGATTCDDFTVTVSNVAPSTEAGADVTISEGSAFSSSGSFIDPGADAWTAIVDYGDGSGAQALRLNPDKTFSLSHTYADQGSYTITVTVTDDDGGAGVDTARVVVSNVNPVVDAGANATIDEGGAFSGSGSFTDPGADTWTASVDYGDGSGVQPLTLHPDKTFSLSHGYVQDGVYTVTVTVTDDDLGSGTDTATVTVNNVLPAFTALTVTPTSLDEDGAVAVTGTFTDPGLLDPHGVTINWGEGAPQAVSVIMVSPGVFSFAASHRYLDDDPTHTLSDSYPIGVAVTDDDGVTGGGGNVAVSNVAPVITGVTGPGPLTLGSPATLAATFIDAGTQDSHECAFAWDDGQPSTTVAASGGSCTAAHVYAGPGVYSVVVTVKDDDTGQASSSYQFVVIYDPNDSFVTGGGWIMSPAGAYGPDPSLTGKANFGFVSKYKKGANVPTGQTEFQFHAGSFNFQSSVYEWLVVAGAKAQYKGSGTVNGAGVYGFLLTATDGQLNGGDGIDKIRIKVWDKVTGAVVYDNKRGTSDDLDAADPQAIGGGSIVIHRN